MTRTVFWSWQSDRSERETRHLIREAMVIALDRLTGETEIDERLEIDHDTRGLPGSPDIVSAILAKIDAAAVFVADITPLAISDQGKHIANPNVLIELGYAKKALGPERVVTIWNTAFTDSRVEDLPFDLRGRRGPITYALPAGASREELAKTRAFIVESLVDRIGGCVGALSAVAPAPRPWQPSVEDDPSIWVAPGTPVRINEDRGSGTKMFVDGGRWYVRILPSSFDPSALDGGVHGPFVGGYGGFSWGQTTGGQLTYTGSVRADVGPELDAATMWFRGTGELWMMQTRISADYRWRPCFYGDYIPENWADLLASGLARLGANGGASPYHVRLGVTGLEGLYWPDVQTFGGEPPVALEPRMEHEFTAPGIEEVDWREGVVVAWTALRQMFGMPALKDVLVEDTIQKATRIG
ncbi:hypothetical protein [Qipengyuania sp. SM2507]